MLDSRLGGSGLRPDRVIVLCSWARHFPLTLPLSSAFFPPNCMLAILLVTSSDKLQQCGPLSLSAEFTILF